MQGNDPNNLKDNLLNAFQKSSRVDLPGIREVDKLAVA